MIILQHTCCIHCNSYDRDEIRPARISAGASISVAKKPNKIKEKKSYFSDMHASSMKNANIPSSMPINPDLPPIFGKKKKIKILK